MLASLILKVCFKKPDINLISEFASKAYGLGFENAYLKPYRIKFWGLFLKLHFYGQHHQRCEKIW
jgi:hypothetical protein